MGKEWSTKQMQHECRLRRVYMFYMMMRISERLDFPKLVADDEEEHTPSKAHTVTRHRRLNSLQMNTF